MVLLIDYNPLCSAFNSVTIAKSDHQQCNLALFTEALFNVMHIKGDQNIADCMFRSAPAILIDTCDLSECVIPRTSTDCKFSKIEDYCLSPAV